MNRLFFSAGALLAGLAVIAGAYGAHGGETALDPMQAIWIAKGARYQMYHGLALLVLSWACSQWPDQAKLWAITGGLFIGGVIFFSGSLYIMALTELRPGYMTPLGGLCFIVAWFCMAGAVWRGDKGGTT